MDRPLLNSKVFIYQASSSLVTEFRLWSCKINSFLMLKFVAVAGIEMKTCWEDSLNGGS